GGGIAVVLLPGQVNFAGGSGACRQVARRGWRRGSGSSHVGIGRGTDRVIGVDLVIVRGRGRYPDVRVAGDAGAGGSDPGEIGPIDRPVNVKAVLDGIVARPGQVDLA